MHERLLHVCLCFVYGFLILDVSRTGRPVPLSNDDANHWPCIDQLCIYKTGHGTQTDNDARPIHTTCTVLGDGGGSGSGRVECVMGGGGGEGVQTALVYEDLQAITIECRL